MAPKIVAGFHVSIADSIDFAVDRAVEIGCGTFQLFTRNPRGWTYRRLEAEKVSLFVEKRKKAGFEKVVAHMPYLPNLSSPVPEVIRKSRSSLDDEVNRCGALGIDYLVVHLGSHGGAGVSVGARNIAEACDEAIQKRKEGKTMILLENMAGQKNSIGTSFEELQLILGGIKHQKEVGVCFDTCHAFAAGFDLSNKTGVERTFELCDDILGLERIKVVHANDSKGLLGSNLDRHEHIGMGMIGEKGFKAILGNKRVRECPLIMETPVDDRKDEKGNLKELLKLAV